MHKEIKKQVIDAIEGKVERERIRGLRTNALIVDDYQEIDKELFDEIINGFVKPDSVRD